MPPTIASNTEEYIAAFSPEVQRILRRIRAIIRERVPEAGEKISYQMPAFTLDGNLIYFAAFKNHLGLYPPVAGDAQLQQDTAPYRGPKGNFKFPFAAPMPYDLIGRIVEARLHEHLQGRAARRKTGRPALTPPKRSAQ